MVVDVSTDLICANPGPHHQQDDDLASVAFVCDQSFSRWWTPRCRACLDRLDRHDQPTRYEVAYIHHPPGPAVPSRPAEADRDNAGSALD